MPYQDRVDLQAVRADGKDRRVRRLKPTKAGVEAIPEIAEVVLDPVMVSAGGAAITKAAVRVAPWRWDDHPHVRRLGG